MTLKKTLFTTLFLVVLFTGGCAFQKDFLNIGIISEENLSKGAELAAVEINQRGIINQEVRIISKKIGCDQKKTENAVHELILANGVRTIISDVCEDSKPIVDKLSRQNKIVVIDISQIGRDGETSKLNKTTAELYKRVYNETSAEKELKAYAAVKEIVEKEY